MVFNKTCTVPTAVDRLWGFITDAQKVSACMPGVESFREVEPDRFEGSVKMALGPISMRLSGVIDVQERDAETRTVRMSAQARDVRIAGDVKATFVTILAAIGENETEIRIDTEAKVLGKLGEFGQPIMKKAADRYLTKFIENIVQALGEQQRAA